MRHPELLLPAGSLPVLKIAVRYGADAVYIGGEAMGLRAKAKNFSPAEMREGIAFAHSHGVKVYVTANIFAHNSDIKEAERYFREMREMRPDALLIADPGMFSLARRICPETDLHISTQANTTNYETCRFWHSLGAKRIVTARELTLEEIREIRDHIPDDLELESFVHGAMCISYSGRCLMSNFLTGRDANHGECTHPCRWKYAVVEEKRPGEYMPVFENDRGSYIFNSKDLCMIDHLPDLYAAGIDSFKIEGRMKTALYAATCARAYRLAMNAYEKDPAFYEKNKARFLESVSEGTFRNYTTGFFYGKPGPEDQNYETGSWQRNDVFLGIVEEIDKAGRPVIHQKNKFSVGDEIYIMKPDGRDIPARVECLADGDGNEILSAPHPKQEIHIGLTSGGAEAWDVLKKKA